MTGFGNTGFGVGPFGLQIPSKPRVFVSYYHAEDQGYYELFAGSFGNAYDLFTDTSLERKVDSEDADYVRRSIREKNITGSSATVVLCGPNTWKRRWVDWEIQMTLNKQHALLGIILPTNQANASGGYSAPQRLVENLNSGYAHFITWPQSVDALASAINTAKERARATGSIVNARDAMKRSLS